MLRLAILVACHNRRELTLRSLRSLAAANAGGLVDYTVVLLNDGSTDGTGEAVLREFPTTLIIEGDGKSFWNGGLYCTWRRAQTIDCDAVVWLNDDVALWPDALEQTVKAWTAACERRKDGKFILVGAMQGPKGEITYGGKRRIRTPWAFKFEEIEPTGQMERIETFNGNYVVVAKAVERSLGLNDPAFFHNLGDIDYGLRASQAGISIWLLPAPVGRCDDNRDKARAGYGSPDLSLFQQWKKVNTHHGIPFRCWWRITSRHSGIWAPLHFLLAYRRLILPRWLLRLMSAMRQAVLN